MSKETENQELDDENENDDAPESGEELGEAPDSLVDEWETKGDSTTYELHQHDESFEVLAVGGALEGEPDDAEHVVLLAVDLPELDEAIGILQEARAKMVELSKGKK